VLFSGALFLDALVLATWLASKKSLNHLAQSVLDDVDGDDSGGGGESGAAVLRRALANGALGSPGGGDGDGDGGGWSGCTAVELGAGLGLVAVVLHRLGCSKVVATDGDASVLEQLQCNADRNHGDSGGAAGSGAWAVGIGGGARGAAALEARLLVWGAGTDPLSSLGLRPRGDGAAPSSAFGGSGGGSRAGDWGEGAREGYPALVLAAGCVYGRDGGVWAALASTIARLAGPATVVLLAHGNGASPGTHAFRGGFYSKLLPSQSGSGATGGDGGEGGEGGGGGGGGGVDAGFVVVGRVSPSSLGPDHAASGCQIHVLMKRPLPRATRAHPGAAPRPGSRPGVAGQPKAEGKPRKPKKRRPEQVPEEEEEREEARAHKHKRRGQVKN